eukprot:9153292-Alexandrium_andersonii.AAC.1
MYARQPCSDVSGSCPRHGQLGHHTFWTTEVDRAASATLLSSPLAVATERAGLRARAAQHALGSCSPSQRLPAP